ncbi:VanZ family protein [Paenibacillus sp. J5C_2022]|uniref:VanZ family protein n=1 Tax=Paenibacillus sp. J5C2022 TaxID=2977129 RepID=UPI0021D1B3FE|nr:VanZ family protein [Paenibacillus sp. J5C2022]MCU6710119.1 VanZ family protein [Paenibacillus sp. J5C2022]
MNAYLFPIKQAIITFPILALALTVPFLIVQYRKYGYVNKLRSTILYSLLLYAITAYYLVILPLPKLLDNCAAYGSFWSYVQWRPFTFVSDIGRETSFAWNSFSSYIQLLKERSFLQVLFNVVLTIPLGIYLRYYFRCSFKGALFLSLGVSLFFELTQVTGLYGIYTCPYRLFDVDDLMLNTTGGIIGFLIAPIVYTFLPRSEKLDDKVNLSELKVGFIRRSIAFAIDLFVLTIVSAVMSLLLSGATLITYQLTSGTLDASASRLLSAGLAVLLYFVLIPAVCGGRTLGKWITRIHVVEDARRSDAKFITWRGLLKRYGLLYFGVFGLLDVMNMIAKFGEITMEASIGILFLQFLLMLGLFVHAIISMVKGDKLLFYERLSGTRNVVTVGERDARKEADHNVEPSVEDGLEDESEQPSAIASALLAEREEADAVRSTVGEASAAPRSKLPEQPEEESEPSVETVPNEHEAQQPTHETGGKTYTLGEMVPELDESPRSNVTSEEVEREMERLRAKLAELEKREKEGKD